MCAAPTSTRASGRSHHDHGVARLFETFGAHALADRLGGRSRVRDGVVGVDLPPAPGQVGTRSIRLYRCFGRDAAVEAIDEHGWRWFEEPTPEVLVRTVRATRGVVYDVGANSGIYSLLAVAADPFTRVVAFEPFPPALEALRNNLALNGTGGRVEVVAAAVADRVGEVDLFVPVDSGALETSASLNGSFKPEIARRLAVPAITLDEHWRRSGQPHVSLIKVDTETTEHQVLAGAAELVRSERPIIVFEVLPGADTDALASFASEHELVVVRLTATRATLDCPVAHDPRGWNQLLVPRERLDAIVEVLRDTGLEIASADDEPEGLVPPEVPAAAPPALGLVGTARDRVDEPVVDPDSLPPIADELGRYTMNLSPIEVTAILAKRAALRAVHSAVARVRR
jgi:FkbM family methyltransferase